MGLLNDINAAAELAPAPVVRAAEAADNAIKIARSYTGKQNIIAFDVRRAWQPCCCWRRLLLLLLPLPPPATAAAAAFIFGMTSNDNPSCFVACAAFQEAPLGFDSAAAGRVPRPHVRCNVADHQQDNLPPELWAAAQRYARCLGCQLVHSSWRRVHDACVACSQYLDTMWPSAPLACSCSLHALCQHAKCPYRLHSYTHCTQSACTVIVVLTGPPACIACPAGVVSAPYPYCLHCKARHAAGGLGYEASAVAFRLQCMPAGCLPRQPAQSARCLGLPLTDEMS